MPQVKGQTTGLMGSAGWVLTADLLQMHFSFTQNSCQPCGTMRRFPANVAADGARPQETILNLATRCRNAATSCVFNKGSSLASRSSPWRLQRSDMSSAAEVNTRGRAVEKVNIYWKLAGSNLRDIFDNISVMTDLIAALVYVQGFFFFHIAAFTVAPPTF